MSELTELPAWQALWDHFAEARHLHMRELFAADPERAERYSLEVGGLFLDYSKNRITDATLLGLMQLAREAGLPAKIKAMFKGEKINRTENRAVLHAALRNRTNSPILVDGEDVMPKVNSVLERMGRFSHAVRSGDWLGYTNQPITDIVNIGIGGSDLGPLMVCSALKPFGHPRSEHALRLQRRRRAAEGNAEEGASGDHAVRGGVQDLHHPGDADQRADRARVVRGARARRKGGGQALRRGVHQPEGGGRLRHRPGQYVRILDWVGGRYSLWSAIGLPIMLYLGEENFTELLNGAHIMDQHFKNAPFEQNMPVLLAMIGVWYINYYGGGSHVIAPYDQYLHRLPAFIQQLDMESNGKKTMLDGQPVNFETAPIIWGETGINGQHAFFQLLHQGTHISPIDLIASLENRSSLPGHHEILLANVFAQAEAFMRGKTADEARAELAEQGLKGEALDELVPHKVFDGNRPTNTLLMSRLDPRNLGSLIALYEHKIFVQGVIWHINSFDQWGVELGKQLAKTIHGELTGKLPLAAHDSSTSRLIQLYRKANA